MATIPLLHGEILDLHVRIRRLLLDNLHDLVPFLLAEERYTILGLLLSLTIILLLI